MGQAAVLLVSPFLTRLYSPSDFGTLSVYASILAILSVVASLRYELAIALPDSDEEGLGVLIVGFACLAVSTASVTLLIVVGDGWLCRLTKTPSLRHVLWLLPVGVFLTGLYQLLNYWAVRQEAYGLVARTRLIQGLGQVMVQLLLGLSNCAATGLILGQVVGQGAGITSLLRLVLKTFAVRIRGIRIGFLVRAALRYRRFPQYATWAGLLNTAGLQMPPLLIAAFYGSHVAGLLALGARVISTPVSLVSNAVAQVYFGEASKLIRTDATEFNKLFRNMVRRLLFYGCPPIIILGFLSPWLFVLLFGSKWFEAGRYVSVLTFAYAAQVVIQPLSQTLNIMDRQDLQLIWDLIRLGLVVGSLLLARTLHCTPIWAIVSYGLGLLISYILLYVLFLYAMKRHLSRLTTRLSTE